MVKDLAKFQKFVSPECESYEAALDKKAVTAYLNELAAPSGGSTKWAGQTSIHFLVSKISDAAPA